MPEGKSLKQDFQKLEVLIGKIAEIKDPEIQTGVRELLQSLMHLHGAGLNRVMEIIWESGESGSALIERLGHDELISHLLLLYGLHPDDLSTRVLKALDKVRPYLRSHGGNVELVSANEGIVQLRMEGSCHGCPSSAMTLKLAIEEAIYEAAPDVVSIEVEGVVEKSVSGFVPREHLQVKRTPITVGEWEEVRDLEILTDGQVQVLPVGERSVLFCSIESTYYAYSSQCPSCSKTLEGAHLNVSVLTCPHCKQTFDVVRAGLGLDQPQIQLEPYPLLVEQSHVKIALPALH